MIFNYTNSRKVQELLRVMNNVHSITLVNYLLKQTEATVTEMCDTFEWPQAVVSQHLAKLRKANIVTGDRDGKQVYYTLNREIVQNLNSLLIKIAEL